MIHLVSSLPTMLNILSPPRYRDKKLLSNNYEGWRKFLLIRDPLFIYLFTLCVILLSSQYLEHMVLNDRMTDE
jgi:hypothetical protein